MTTLSAPSSISFLAAAATAPSSSATRTRPSASRRASISRRRWRSIRGTKRPLRPYGVGRVRRPSSRTSRKPFVVIRPTVAIFLSSIALVVVVVPWTIASSDAGSTPAAASAARTPNAWLSTVVGTLAIRTSPLASSTTIRSVNVPPTSMPAMRRVGLRETAMSEAEVGAQQHLVAHQRLHRADELHLALLENDGAIGDEAGEVQVLLGEQDRHAFLLQGQDHVDHLLDDQRRDAFARLVEEDEVGVAHQRARDRQHLLLAAAHAAAGTVGHRREVGKQRVQLVLGPGRRAVARRLTRDREVLAHAQVGEDAAVLRHPAEAETADAVRRQRRDVGAAKDDAATPARHQSHDRLHRRRLAGAVATDQRDAFAGADAERDAEEHLRLAIPGLERLHIKHRSAPPPTSARTSFRRRSRPRARARRRAPPPARPRRSARRAPAR